MLQPLVPADFPVAAALLAEGFPARTLGFWQEGLRRIERHAGNARCGVPLGYLLRIDGEAVGVTLTPATTRRMADGAIRRVVNFSSLYLREAHRWRTVQFFRTVLSDPQTTYLDLTPAEHVRPMLPLFGFRPVSVGHDIVALPAAACGAGHGASLRALRETDALPPGAPDMAILMAHRELGCEPLLLEHPEGSTLFVYRRRPMRGVPAARLKFVGSHRALRRHLPLLARHCLARGMLVLTWDARAELPPPRLGYRRPTMPWYARGPVPDDCTDFIGSELCLLGV